jgi:hypothetical protein
MVYQTSALVDKKEGTGTKLTAGLYTVFKPGTTTFESAMLGYSFTSFLATSW